MKYTLDQVKTAWDNFIKYTETAEQHEFVKLAMFQMRVEPLYNDLCENWDDHHADIFMKGMQFASNLFGFKIPDISEKGE